MLRKKILIFAVVLAVGVGISIHGEPAGYNIVVNKARPDQDMALKDLKKIFLGEITTWPDGTGIKLAVLKTGESHNTFIDGVLKMTAIQFSTYWKRKVFSGGATGTDIQYFKTEKSLKEYIASEPGSIGYLSPASVDDTVKVIPVK